MVFENKKMIGMLSLLAAFALSLLCVSCAGTRFRSGGISIETAAGKAIPVTVEFACTDAEREKGFMGRASIPDGSGMIFAFKNDQVLRFWMKNTPHSLSIAYIASDGTIRDILNMEPFSIDVIPSSGSVRYALEVPQGWFSRVGISVGDRLSAASLAAIESLEIR